MAKTINIPCFACAGRGYFDVEDKRGQCPECAGSGEIIVDEVERKDDQESSAPNSRRRRAADGTFTPAEPTADTPDEPSDQPTYPPVT